MLAVTSAAVVHVQIMVVKAERSATLRTLDTHTPESDAASTNLNRHNCLCTQASLHKFIACRRRLALGSIAP
jgi:hypothetical protein